MLKQSLGGGETEERKSRKKGSVLVTQGRMCQVLCNSRSYRKINRKPNGNCLCIIHTPVGNPFLCSVSNSSTIAGSSPSSTPYGAGGRMCICSRAAESNPGMSRSSRLFLIGIQNETDTLKAVFPISFLRKENVPSPLNQEHLPFSVHPCEQSTFSHKIRSGSNHSCQNFLQCLLEWLFLEYCCWILFWYLVW